MRLPRLHVVTDDEVLARPDVVERAIDVLEAGQGAVALHLRGPRSAGGHLYRVARSILAASGVAPERLVMNDRVDVALVAGVGNVHLGERSLSVAQARSLLPAGARVGCSVHDEAEARQAESRGADYVFVGSVYRTQSHPGGVGLGVSAAAHIGRQAGVPWIGIGGVTPDLCAEVVRAGSHGAAVLGGIWRAEDPVSAVQRYVSALDDTGRARSDP